MASDERSGGLLVPSHLSLVPRHPTNLSRGEHMAFRRDSRPAPDQIEAVIGPRATFDGRLRCDGSVRVDGTVEGGSIETLGNVLITAGARVTADIKAKTVSVAGGYQGTIIADRVELLEGGRLWGVINVRTFLLDEGAHFDGQLVMRGTETDQPLLMARPAEGDIIPVVVEEVAGSATPVEPADSAAAPDVSSETQAAPDE
jgi:cytoskeletal protein CcmA (bactofilin family)